MNALLTEIRERPLSFLPAPSLTALQAFIDAYSIRAAMEGRDSSVVRERRGFQKWLCDRFQLVGARPISGFTIIASFSKSESEAFANYFLLLEEYLRIEQATGQDSLGNIPPEGFIDMVKAIRKTPGMYLGSPTFLGCCSYLMGDQKAYLDLGTHVDDERSLLPGFCTWVESTKNRSGVWRPWFKIIEFWSGGIDYSSSSSDRFGAFARFYGWLDQYATEIGRPGLFKISGEGIS